MLGWLEQVNESINGVVWGPVTLFLFLATGIWFTLGTGWFQLSKIGLIFRNTLGNLGKNRLRKNGGISPFRRCPPHWPAQWELATSLESLLQ